MRLASRNTPKYRVKVGGGDLAPPLAAALREIHVDQAVDMADMCTLVFENERARVSDDRSLQPGARVQVELGYEENGGRTFPVIDGEVVAIKASFPRRGPASVRFQIYTRHHRLQRGRHTRAFNGLPYSGIAARIAQEVGLEPAIDPTEPAIEMVFQRNQTNLEFLCELAARVGYEVFAGDGKLFFRKPTWNGAKVRTLRRGEDLLAFNPRVQAALVPPEVHVLGWGLDKQPIEGRAGEGDEGPDYGGQKKALALSQEIGPQGVRQLIRGVVLPDAAAATAVARTSLQAAAQTAVRAVAQLAGAPDLRPGFIVEVDGVGEVFSGEYYIRRVVHAYLQKGFATTLFLSRSSIRRPPPSPPRPPPRPEEPAQVPPRPAAQVLAAVGEMIEPPPTPPGRPETGIAPGAGTGKRGKG